MGTETCLVLGKQNKVEKSVIRKKNFVQTGRGLLWLPACNDKIPHNLFRSVKYVTKKNSFFLGFSAVRFRLHEK